MKYYFILTAVLFFITTIAIVPIANATITITPEMHDCIKKIMIGAGMFGVGQDKEGSVDAYTNSVEKCITDSSSSSTNTSSSNQSVLH
jgi:hypothetical protein